MSDTANKTALVLGATGGIGGEVASALLRRGWRVRALHRDPATARRRSGLDLDWVSGDAMAADSVAAAAKGVSLLVHGVNPPGYRNWPQLVLPMLDSSIRAAERAGARILLPGTVYNYGPDAFPAPAEDAPQHPLTRKGGIRVEMERRLEAAAARGVPVLIVRAGDFFGPRAANNWMGQGLVRPGQPVRSITYPGRKGVGHLWAYVPDVAETMARLVERAGSGFERFHMEGHWDPDGTAMIGAIRRAVGGDVPVRGLPWPVLGLLSPVVPLFRELWEMRYLWRRPLRLDNGRLVATLGAEPRTPLDEAVRTTLIGLGCLPAT